MSKSGSSFSDLPIRRKVKTPVSDPEILKKIKLAPPDLVLKKMMDELTALFFELVNNTNQSQKGRKKSDTLDSLSSGFWMSQKTQQNSTQAQLQYVEQLLNLLMTKLLQMEATEKEKYLDRLHLIFSNLHVPSNQADQINQIAESKDSEAIRTNYGSVLNHLNKESVELKGQSHFLIKQLDDIKAVFKDAKVQKKISLLKKKKDSKATTAETLLEYFTELNPEDLFFSEVHSSSKFLMLVRRLAELTELNATLGLGDAFFKKTWSIINIIMDSPNYLISLSKESEDKLREGHDPKQEKDDDSKLLSISEVDLQEAEPIEDKESAKKDEERRDYILACTYLNREFMASVLEKLKILKEVNNAEIDINYKELSSKINKDPQTSTIHLSYIFQKLLEAIQKEKNDAEENRRAVNRDLMARYEEISNLIFVYISNPTTTGRHYYDAKVEEDNEAIRKITQIWFEYLTSKTLDDYEATRKARWRYKLNQDDNEDKGEFNTLAARNSSLMRIRLQLAASRNNPAQIPNIIKSITEEIDSTLYHTGWRGRPFGGNANSKLVYHLKEIRKEATDKLYYLNKRYGIFAEEYNQVRQYNNISFDHELAKRLLDFNKKRKFFNSFLPQALRNLTIAGIRIAKAYTDPSNTTTAPYNHIKNPMAQKGISILPEGPIADAVGKLEGKLRKDDYESLIKELTALLGSGFVRQKDLSFDIQKDEAEHYVVLIERLGECINTVGSNKPNTEFHKLLKQLQYDLIARVVTGITYDSDEKRISDPKFLVKFSNSQKQRIYQSCSDKKQLEDVARLNYQQKQTGNSAGVEGQSKSKEAQNKNPNERKKHKIEIAYSGIKAELNHKIQNNIPVTDNDLARYMFIRSQYEMFKNPLTLEIYNRMKKYLTDMHLAARVVRSGVVANSSSSEDAGKVQQLKGIVSPLVKMVPYAGPALQIVGDMAFDHIIGLANSRHSAFIYSNADFVEDINEIDQFAVMLASKLASQYLYLFPSASVNPETEGYPIELEGGQISTFVETVVKRFEKAKSAQLAANPGMPLDINDLIDRMNLSPVRHGNILGMFPTKQTIKTVEKSEGNGDKKKPKKVKITSEDAYNCVGVYTVDPYGNVTFYARPNADLALYGFRKVTSVDSNLMSGKMIELTADALNLHIQRYPANERQVVREKIEAIQQKIRKNEQSFYRFGTGGEKTELDLAPLVADMVTRQREEQACDGVYHVDSKGNYHFYSKESTVLVGYRKLSDQEYIQLSQDKELPPEKTLEDDFQKKVKAYEGAGLYHVDSNGETQFFTHKDAKRVNVVNYGFRKMTGEEYEKIIVQRSVDYVQVSANDYKKQTDDIEQQQKGVVIYWFDKDNQAHFYLPYGSKIDMQMGMEVELANVRTDEMMLRVATPHEVSQLPLLNEINGNEDLKLKLHNELEAHQNAIKEKFTDQYQSQKEKALEAVTHKLETLGVKNQKSNLVVLQ